MDWTTESIAIGNSIEGHDPGLRRRRAFRAVISLDGSMSDETALVRGYEECVCLSLVEGTGNEPRAFRRIVEELVAMDEGSPPELVHCHAGRSRSVAVVAGCLVHVNGWSVRAAVDHVGSRREIALQAGLFDLLHDQRRP